MHPSLRVTLPAGRGTPFPLHPGPFAAAMTPKEIVHELDKHIVGQAAAKRAVAVALRNRWRRQQVDEPLRQEITPKNILMIGPTGVGKTEIARRLARLANAPFIKIEATKFTEVGYVGRDVDTIIRDLMETAVKQMREQATSKVQFRAEEAAEDRILDALLPPPRSVGLGESEPPARGRRGAPAFPQDAARRRARRQGNRDRAGRSQPQHGNLHPAGNGRPVAAAAGHVPEPRARPPAGPQAESDARHSSC